MDVKRLSLLAFFMCSASLANSQQTKLKKLFIGDTIPDISFETIINAQMKSSKISDFKGKLILLDFWSIWCAGCIKAMPKMEMLQKTFGDKIVILPVSFSRKKSEVEQFLKKKELHGEGIGLPIPVYETMDNEIMKMFPVPAFPLIIWIDGNRKIRGITDSFVVTQENIQNVLDEPDFDLPVSEMYERLNGRKSGNDNVADSNKALLKAEIEPYSNHVKNNTLTIEQNKNYTSISYSNTSVINLIKASIYHIDNGDFYNQFLKVEIPDSSYLFYPKKDSSYYSNMKKNAFSYKLLVPSKISISRAYGIMNRDISEFFAITSEFQKKAVPCLVLQRINEEDQLKTKGGKNQIHLNKEFIKRTSFSITNEPISTLTAFLVSKGFPPIVDETNYPGNVDIVINFYKDDLKSLNQNLLFYGLVLKNAEREKEVLIIKKRDPL